MNIDRYDSIPLGIGGIFVLVSILLFMSGSALWIVGLPFGIVITPLMIWLKKGRFWDESIDRYTSRNKSHGENKN